MFNKDMAVVVYNHPSLRYPHVLHTTDLIVLVFDPQPYTLLHTLRLRYVYCTEIHVAGSLTSLCLLLDIL